MSLHRVLCNLQGTWQALKSVKVPHSHFAHHNRTCQKFYDHEQIIQFQTHGYLLISDILTVEKQTCLTKNIIKKL